MRRATARHDNGLIGGAEVVEKADITDRFGAASPAAAPIVVVCSSIAGSGPVVRQLHGLGYTAVWHVDGGFPAWRSAGLPVVAAGGAR